MTDPRDAALRQIVAVMGPKAPPCCEGCEYEWNEALKIARAALDARLTSSEVLGTLLEDEEDPVRLWAEIHRLRAAMQGPDGYATWQEAATAERVRRVRAERALITAAPQTQRPVRLTEEEIVMHGLMMLPSSVAEDCARTFEAGVRFAERAHGIDTSADRGEQREDRHE